VVARDVQPTPAKAGPPVSAVVGHLEPARSMKLDVVISVCTILLGMGMVPVAAAAPSQAAGSPAWSGSGAVQAERPGAVRTEPGAWIWLDVGVDPVLQPGDEVRVYFRSASDAFAAVFHLDTTGRLRLVFPEGADATGVVHGNRDYRLLHSGDPLWKVNEPPGTGHFFLLAAAEPLDLSAASFADAPARGLPDAMDEVVEALLPEWERAGFHLTFLSYHVGDAAARSHRICYDCETAVPGAATGRFPVPVLESRGAPGATPALPGARSDTPPSRPVLERRPPGGGAPGGVGFPPPSGGVRPLSPPGDGRVPPP
jgi:hypothetical protein